VKLMDSEKKMLEGGNIKFSFTFNPEEYMKKDWQIMESVNQMVINDVYHTVSRELEKEVAEYYKNNKKIIIENVKNELSARFADKIEELGREL